MNLRGILAATAGALLSPESVQEHLESGNTFPHDFHTYFLSAFLLTCYMMNFL
jgi:hypothetical protein